MNQSAMLRQGISLWMFFSVIGLSNCVLFGNESEILDVKNETLQFFVDRMAELIRSECTAEEEENCTPGVCEMTDKAFGELINVHCKCSGIHHPIVSEDVRRPGKMKASCVERACERCHPTNTLSCSVVPPSTAICKCDSFHSSASLCHEPRDSCKKGTRGYEMCGVAHGNSCYTVISNDEMREMSHLCGCIFPYMRDSSIQLSNCLGRADSFCARSVCLGSDTADVAAHLRGKPMALLSSEFAEARCSYNTSTCICPQGFYGKHCLEQRGSIAIWHNDVPCKPECVDVVTGIRTSLITQHPRISARTAECDQANLDYCQGNLREWILCQDVSICPIKKPESLRQFVAKLQNRTYKETRVPIEWYMRLWESQMIESLSLLLFVTFCLLLVFAFYARRRRR